VDAPDPLMDACLLHCVAHVAAAAARIRKNNERAKSGNIDAETPRDQGFTRAKARAFPPSHAKLLRMMALPHAQPLASLASCFHT
jgi:hypothetical protein